MLSLRSTGSKVIILGWHKLVLILKLAYVELNVLSQLIMKEMQILNSRGNVKEKNP